MQQQIRGGFFIFFMLTLPENFSCVTLELAFGGTKHSGSSIFPKGIIGSIYLYSRLYINL
jgi:hypothetical protein